MEGINDALMVLKHMSKEGCEPNVLAYHRIFGSLQKPREIPRLSDKMIENGMQPRMDTCVMLMRKSERWGFLQPAFVVWKKMEERGVSSDEFAYHALIDALVQKGMVDMARKYDEEMVAKGLSANGRLTLLLNGAFTAAICNYCSEN